MIRSFLFQAKRIIYKKTIFRRLIISFVCILIPIFFLSAIIHDWSVSTLREEISTSMDAQVSYYLDSLENEILRIRNLQYNFIGEVSLNKLATISESMSNIERIQNIKLLQQRLGYLLSGSAYINDVFVLIPSLDRKITAFTVAEFVRSSFDMFRYNPIEDEEQFLSIDDKLYLCTEYPYYGIERKKEPIFIIVIEISKTKIEDYLKMMNSGADEGAVLIYSKIDSDSRHLLTSKPNFQYRTEILEHVKNEPVGLGTVSSVDFNYKPYLFAHRNSGYLGMTLCKYVPQESVFAAIRKYVLWLILLIASAIIIIILYSFYTYQIIHKPLNKLAKSFGNVENGDLSFYIHHNSDDEFRYIYSQFNVMVKNLETLIDQVYKQKILAQRAELKQLQSQINPHFLYNSFFIIKTMSRIGDNEGVEQFTDQLGKYFQFITRNDSEDVTLKNEVEHARVYSEIQATRFSNRISVKFDELPSAYDDYIVPRLILQPIIENVFEHGLKSIPQNGILRVSFNETEDELQIIIEDNGNSFSDEKLEEISEALAGKTRNTEVTGIINIDQRLKLKYKQQTGLQISRSGLGGLKVTVCLSH